MALKQKVPAKPVTECSNVGNQKRAKEPSFLDSKLNGTVSEYLESPEFYATAPTDETPELYPDDSDRTIIITDTTVTNNKLQFGGEFIFVYEPFPMFTKNIATTNPNSVAAGTGAQLFVECQKKFTHNFPIHFTITLLDRFDQLVRNQTLGMEISIYEKDSTRRVRKNYVNGIVEVLEYYPYNVPLDGVVEFTARDDNLGLCAQFKTVTEQCAPTYGKACVFFFSNTCLRGVVVRRSELDLPAMRRVDLLVPQQVPQVSHSELPRTQRDGLDRQFARSPQRGRRQVVHRALLLPTFSV